MSFAFLLVNVGMITVPAIGSLIIHSSVFNVFPIAALLTALCLMLLGIAKRLPVQSD
jgi:hypothetical protein